MIIAGDVNQFTGSHEKSNAPLHRALIADGHTVEKIPLPFGDYCQVTEQMQDTINRRGDKLKKADLVGDVKISVDRKNSIDELCGNICGKSHARFRDECILAQKCGCKLYILVENSANIRSVRDVFRWQNPRLYRYKRIQNAHACGKMLNVDLPKQPPTNGVTLAKSLLTMQAKYGVTFVFCAPREAPQLLVRLLNGEEV